MNKQLICSIITILVILIVYSYISKRYNAKSTFKLFNFNKNNGKYLSLSTLIALVLLIIGYIFLSSYEITHRQIGFIDTNTVIRFVYISIAMYTITNIITIIINCIYNLVIKIKNDPTSFYDDLDTPKNASLIKSINEVRDPYYKNNKYDKYIYSGTGVLYEILTLYMIIMIIIYNVIIVKYVNSRTLKIILILLLVLVPVGFGIYNTIKYYIQFNNKISLKINHESLINTINKKIINALLGKTADDIGFKENIEELLFIATIVITLSIYIMIMIILLYLDKKKYVPIVDNYNYLINKNT